MAGAFVGAAAFAGAVDASQGSTGWVPSVPDRLPADTDSDLARVAGRAQDASGPILYLTGQVRDAAGREVTDARVEIWHVDAQGRDPFSGADADADFQGYGMADSGADGRYGFRTVRPGASADADPYVNIRVSAPGFGAMITRVTLVATETDALGLGASVAVMAAAPGAEPGALAARYDIVLNYNASAPA